MPGPWTPEHRAAFEARIAARRAGVALEPKPPRTRRPRTATVTGPVVLHDFVTRGDFERMAADLTTAVLRDSTDVLIAIRGLEQRVSPKPIEDLAERLRQTAIRMESRLALMAHESAQTAQTPDAQLLAAMRALNGRLAAVEVVVRASETRDTEILHLLRRLDSRPARVIEFRPDTTRVTEGGTPVRAQRRANGMTKRDRGFVVPRISPITGRPRKTRSDKGVVGGVRPTLLDDVLADAAGE